MVEDVLSKVFWVVSATVFAAATVGYAQQVPCYFIFGDSVFDSGNNNNLQTKAKVNFLPYGELSGFKDFIPPLAGTSPERAHIGMNYASGAGGLREETSEHLVRRFKVRHKACCTLSPGEELCTPNKPVCANRSEYVFWDDIHSSEATNIMMARSSFDGPLGSDGPLGIASLISSTVFLRLVSSSKTRPSRSIAGIVVRCSKSEESGLGFARLEGESWKMHGGNLRCLQRVLCFYKKRTTVSIWDKLLQTNH
ncbi:hypothetical protein Bca101_058160 [Brassica carinata]